MLLDRVSQIILSAALWSAGSYQPDDGRKMVQGKRIAIVGGGSAGLGALAGIESLPEEARLGWQIDLLEQRRGLGGVWLPDEHPPHPPQLPDGYSDLPETPLYPRLRTNTPHPTMTYPHFPFPPLTPLYPTHSHVQAYHAAFAKHLNLSSSIHVGHKVVAGSFSAEENWTLSISVNGSAPINRIYDTVIDASGHNHYPYVPEWDGVEEWVNGGDDRVILHSIYYREPEVYKGRTVIVVGFSASGGDIASQVTPFASKLYHSYTNATDPLGRGKTPIKDGSRIYTRCPTTILLGTGYEVLVPYLDSLAVVPALSLSHPLKLATNKRYIRALHRVIFAIDEHIPLGALAFVGLPVWIANAPSDFAQGLFVAHSLADPMVLPPSKEAALKELEANENLVRRQGNDPFWIGHRFATDNSSQDYQDDLISHIRTTSSFPLPDFLSDPSVPFVEPWRRKGREHAILMRRGWLRAEELGLQTEFLEGATTERDWENVMDKIAQWERDWEADHESEVKVMDW